MRRRPTGWKSRSRRSWRTTASAATVTRPARARARPCSPPEPPTVADAVWSRNPVDRFLRARLAAEGLKPAPPAERRALIRRVFFDVTGLPPDPAEVEAFVTDPAADAYEKLVDRLLASPRY